MTAIVCVVDDDQSVREAVRGLLASAGYAVAAFDSGAALLSSSELREAACLIVDLMMPEMSGLELQEVLANDGYRVPLIFISAHATDRVRRLALERGATAFFDKPFSDEELLAKVASLMS